MKKMNNYEAPVAELIELNVNHDFMAGIGGTPTMVDSSENSGNW